MFSLVFTTYLVRDGHQSKKPGRFGWPPLSASAVRQRYHHRLKLVTRYFKFAHRFELHGLSGKVLLWRDGVGEDVQKETSTARRVHPESHDVAHHTLVK